MSTKCLGVTAKGVKCTKPCKGGVRYCNLHKDQCNNTNVSTSVNISTNSVTNTPANITRDVRTQECSICLCDMCDTHKPYNLECFHVYHKECIKEWLESGDNDECPVCKAKISQNIMTSLNINEAKRGNNITLDEETKLLEDEEYALSIANTNDELPFIPHVLLQEEPQSDIERAIQESLISQEIDDYEFMAKALEYSCQFAEKEEEELIEKTIKMNLEEEIEARSNESVPEMISRLMNGNTHITIKLR